MSVDPARHAPTPSSPPPQHAPRRATVLLMILATAVIFVALFVVLYVRWASSQEPSSVLVVSATPAFKGAQLVVDGVALSEPYRVTIGSRQGNDFPFYLDRGSYTLSILRDEAELYTADFVMRNNQLLRIELAKLEHLLPPPPATNAGAPSTR